ncbi:MAG TPA: 2-dehydropantoate 2-reductase [Anaerolineales bacterium]|jgi:2-dehydropantoate 2-reductase|nr:2-dehydropantoate 2-reductase [Anaerolineales bacterium]
MMRIAVFGTGGVGGYFGGRLAQGGEDVVFIARGEHLRAMRANGLRVDSLNGDFVIEPIQATDMPQEDGEVDAILVAVKAWQVPDAALAMRPMVGENTFVVPLENGVDAPAQLMAVLGEEHVLGGLCHIVSYIAEPGHIRHAGIEPHVAFGELDGRPSERAEQLKAAFERGGVWAEVPEDIRAAMWEKFLFIAAMSGVGAVTRAPAGVMRSLPETRRLLQNAMEEVVAVGKAHKVNLPDDVVEKTMAFIDNLPEGATASMQRDIIEGRPSELESQNGAVLRLGSEQGVPTPIHAFLYHSLLPQELRARGEVDF